MLQALGLGQDAEDLYQAMLEAPLLGISDLCEQLGLPEHRVRAALDELVRSTLLRESRETPGQLRVVSPDIGLAALLRRQEAELARRQQELAASKARVAETVAQYADLQENGKDRESQRLVGLDAIQGRLEVLAQEVAGECLSVMAGGGHSEATLKAARPLDQSALDRGVQLYSLYQESARNDPATWAYARWMTEAGGQVRTAPVLPPRMLIFDRTVAVVPIDPKNTGLGALCTREPAVVAALAAVYDQAWSTAIPLGAQRAPDADTGLTQLDRELLALLGTGLTDEAAGNRLGVSARTVRRQMAALMERLNATSRFEAGLKAAQKGWL
ncbi:LuxR C-terminal-related transcriptional regulator [Kitasatospora sp. NPDC006697]|uniref:LuxR C-terminal-related transcriptional regulator n=1 Tax=Kitasatospora sp. NPDC006697 TaxID=3364020 RepID=UPI0036865CD3